MGSCVNTKPKSKMCTYMKGMMCMTRLLYGGCTTFKPRPQKLYSVILGIKNWEIYLNHPV